jgi:hypothetical protein
MIVEDRLDRCMGRIGGVDQLEEFDEFAAAMAILDQGMNLLPGRGSCAPCPVPGWRGTHVLLQVHARGYGWPEAASSTVRGDSQGPSPCGDNQPGRGFIFPISQQYPRSFDPVRRLRSRVRYRPQPYCILVSKRQFNARRRAAMTFSDP